MKNEYEVRGNVVSIFLNRKDGTKLECLIDLKHFPLVNRFPNTWYAWKSKKSNTFYVRGDIGGRKNKKSFYLHKYLLGDIDKKVIDHKNNNGLDNRSENLRVINQYQNLQNRVGANRTSKSGKRNVSWCNREKKWFVQIRVKNKRNFIGYFKTIEEATLEAQEARKKLMPYSKEATKKEGV